MARPAIVYSSLVNAPGTVFHYDEKGKLTGTSPRGPRPFGWRELKKNASVTTPPTSRGKFVTPTNYFCEWGRGSCRPGELLYSLSNTPNSAYDIEYDALVSTLSREASSLYVPSTWIWNELEVKALNKLRHVDINLGVALAEAKETQHLIVSNSKTIAKGISSLPYATRQKARQFCGRVPSKVPSRYLEFMYGVNPLLADIQGAGEALANYQRQEGNTFQVRTKKVHQGSVKVSEAVNYASSAFSVIPFKADNRVLLRYNLSCPILARLSSLGLVNPLEIVWERVPYSFVVDWLLPIGNWLSALSGDFGFTFIHGYKSTFCTFEERGLTSVSPLFPNGRYSADLRVTTDFGYFRRTKYSSSPVPGLYIKSPVSAHHIAEALSLLATSFRR